MTKASTRGLRKGQELFNTDTGEVAYFTAAIGTVGETVFIETMDRNGRPSIWTHKKTERV